MSSTNNDRQTAGELVPVKFSRLTRRGVLLGLSLGSMRAYHRLGYAPADPLH